VGANSALQALRVPGIVLVDGVEIGLLRDVQLRRVVRGGRTELTAEEYKGEVVDQVYGGIEWRLGMALRGFDAKAIECFPNVSGGSVVWPGTNRDGYFRAADTVAVTFTPLETSHPGITIASAIPEVAEDLSVDLGKRSELLILCSFLVTRESGTLAWG